MATFKITLAYDGGNFVGWQRQAAGASVQGLIEDALRELDGHDVPVAGAGRTDAGVHALGQVASFVLARSIETEALVRALNVRLPADVRVLSAELAPVDFHARFGAKRKTYRYRICNADVINPFDRRYAWHLIGPLDVDAMAVAARCLEGRHDFSAFQAAGTAPRTPERLVTLSRIVTFEDGTTPIRDIRSTALGGALISYEIAGDGFLRHMVRAIVGSLVEIGRGRWPIDRMQDVLASHDRRRAGPTAPAEGLFLVAVEYGDL